MNSLPPPIPPPPISAPPGPPSNDDSNFIAPLRYDRLAIASLVCAIGMFSTAFMSALPAFVLGILSLKRIKDEPKRLKGHGMALAGMILGAIPLAFFVFILGYIVVNGELDLPW